MEDKIEQVKHEIAFLTENILYSRIRALDEDDRKSDEAKNESKNEMIDVFTQEYIERYPELAPEQIKAHILFVLNRTIENTKKLKQESER